MTEIRREHVEYAVVERLGKMLDGPRHPDFNVTQAYSLFGQMLCWTLQRIRNPGTSDTDKAAKALFTQLGGQRIEEAPWKFNTSQFPEFRGMTADAFLIHLRNAIAHGDGRKVTPVHERAKLIGFSLECEEKTNGRRKKVGTIKLTESDMRRLGFELATAFCNTLRKVSQRPNEWEFSTMAHSVVERSAIEKFA